MILQRSTILALFFSIGFAADDGQGTAVPGSRTDTLQPGTHLFGPRFDAARALGKVVVVEIGGS